MTGVIEFPTAPIETNDLAARIEALKRGAGRPRACKPGSPNSNGGDRRSRRQEQIERLAEWLSELQERAKREPWLEEHADALFAFIGSITDRPPNR